MSSVQALRSVKGRGGDTPQSEPIFGSSQKPTVQAGTRGKWMTGSAWSGSSSSAQKAGRTTSKRRR